MNYLTEILAFNDLIQVKQLATGQIALWYALMYINNKCGWQEWFTVSNLTLQLQTGLSRDGINKSRNILKQNGLLDFKQNTTKATSYKLNTMSKFIQVSSQVSIQDSSQVSSQISSALNKQNKTKQNKIVKEKVKEKYGEYSNVLLTEKEYQSLCSDFTNADELIKFLDEYIEMKGYKAKSHYLAIRKWVKDAVSERKPTQQTRYNNAIQISEEQKMAERERQKKMLQEAIDRGDFDVKHGRHV